MSEELFARLARLRRESRTPAEAPKAPGVEPLPGWLTARLGARGAETESFGGGVERRLDPPAELVEASNARGSFSARTRDFASEHRHGDGALGELLRAPCEEFAWLARDPALEDLAPERCVYLDIETTGLSGGAGTIPFLVALGRFEPGADGGPATFRLWQAFLRDPSEEAAALVEIAARIRASAGVVSFFGKSFDRHRLEDKMRLHRIAPPFAERPHLDLYHPLNRLYRGAFSDGRLATLERELCGVAREDDLPGSLAPAAWFDFLAGRPHRLEAVFRHNELDVLSLVSLAAHLACARRETRPDGRALPGPGLARARALAALHAARKEHAVALVWIERGLTRASTGEGDDEGELRFRRAEALRKLGRRSEALAAFLELARARRDALGALAWGEVLRLARRARQAELEAEARLEGRAAVERNLTGRARGRALAPFERAGERGP